MCGGIYISSNEKVQKYRDARNKFDEMNAKMGLRELIYPQDLTETRRVVEAALAVIICPGRIRYLENGFEKIIGYCSSVHDRDIFPVGSMGLNTDESIGRLKVLVMMAPLNYVLRDLVVPANDGTPGYRKMFAVPAQFEGPSLHDIKEVAAIGGLTLFHGEWMPVKLSANGS